MDAAMSLDTIKPVDDIEMDLLLEAIHQRYRYDFRGYSQSSIKRRLAKAQQHFECRTLSALQEKVLHEPELFRNLLGFLTVQVSEMFRDPPYFKALRQKVIPHLRTYPSLKVWIAGCGDGEEFYSLAILLREEGLEDKTIFYATDLNPAALRKAEAGIYDLDRIPTFTENHRLSGGKSSLSDYYSAAYGAAVFDRTLRARAVFSEHSLVSDEVFSEVHLISCRNVLIYFDQALQNRAVGLFKEAAVHGGFLGLGAKETLRFSAHENSFANFAPEERIYRRVSASKEFRNVLS